MKKKRAGPSHQQRKNFSRQYIIRIVRHIWHFQYSSCTSINHPTLPQSLTSKCSDTCSHIWKHTTTPTVRAY